MSKYDLTSLRLSKKSSPLNKEEQERQANGSRLKRKSLTSPTIEIGDGDGGNGDGEEEEEEEEGKRS
jgi:hypothetical protein